MSYADEVARAAERLGPMPVSVRQNVQKMIVQYYREHPEALELLARPSQAA